MDSNYGDLLANDRLRLHYEWLVHWATFGVVTGEAWQVDAQQHLAELLPFRSMLGVFGRRSFDQIEMLDIVSINHPAEHISALSRTFHLRDRPILAQWLALQVPLVVDISQTASASALERDEVVRYDLDRIALHGHLDVLGHTGTYFSFTGLSHSVLHEHARCILALVVPHLHVALCRRARQSHETSSELTDPERELWRWLVAGRRSSEIAAISGCSEKTIRNRLTRLYRKLGVGSRAEAVREFLLRMH